MKPDWDKLMGEFKDSKTTLVADVDCTAAGQPLCETHGVRGYPTIKYGDPAGLEDYKGGRDYASLEKFAKELKPTCSPMNIDLCGDEDKAKIEKLLAMSDSDLDSEITKKETEISDAEATFKSEVEKLQKAYEGLSKTKDDTIKKVKDDGLGLMKSVKAKLAKDGKKAKDDL